MAYRGALLASLRAAIGTVWPEVVANGIVRTSQSARSAVDGRVNAGQLPCAAVEFQLEPVDDWGGDTKAEAGAVLVYYLATDALDVDALEAKLEALSDYLWANDELTNGQVISNPLLVDPSNTPLMGYFLRTQRAFTTGVVSVPLVAGEY